MGDRCSLRSKHPRSASISVDNIVDCPVRRPVGHADHPADYHVDSPDEDPIPTFTNGLAAHEKVAQIADLLKKMALEFQYTALVKHWLT
jgi:hypothetical protein